MDRKKKWMIIVLVGCWVFILSALASINLTEIQVKGNSKYQSDEVINMIFSEKWDRNSLYCLIKDKIKPHKKLPFIEDYQISWKSPFSVEVIVYEKNMVGYVEYMSSYMYFDKDGIVVESSSEELPGIPEITGLDFGHIVLYEELPVKNKEVFGDILNLTGSLSEYDMQTNEIIYDKYNNATLCIGDIQVKLGGNQDMEMKISTLHDILPYLEGKKGSLDLSTYQEGDEARGYIFKLEK